MSDNYEKMKEIIIHKLGVDENKITKEINNHIFKKKNNCEQNKTN